MIEIFPKTSYSLKKKIAAFRARIAKLLGVEADNKENLYIELSRGATLYDLVYWLQILFSAGIATLGLVLNSPAVIIGAMLISPLMGPILAAGLALASGDMALGLRSLAKLFLSSVLAIGFAVLLVAILPFREMTDEITARTQPNTLDLVIALFSGAVGSIAVCRDVKGVATSIPGVAIAVALMPPLCVAGYGLGLILTFDVQTGWRVASGGGLLFLTNLVAITFTAMIVFLAIRLYTPRVRERAEEWGHQDPESAFILNFISRFPRLEQAREIRNLPIRFLMILIPLIAILIPLTQSFSQLRREIAQQKRENVIRQQTLDIWQQYFQRTTDGVARSTVDKLTILEKDDKLNINLRLFDDEPYTASEKNQYVKLVAERLVRPVESISLSLTEIPTTSVLAALRKNDKDRAMPTAAELQANLWRQVDAALSSIKLPPNARLLNRQLVTNDTNSLNVKLTYLGEENLAPEAQLAIIEKLRSNFKDSNATISLERVPTELGTIEFARNSPKIPVLGMLQLDFVGRVMRENPSLILSVDVQLPRRAEGNEITTERLQAISDYLESRWQIAPTKITASDVEQANGETLINFQMNQTKTPEAIPETLPQPQTTPENSPETK